MCRKQTIGYIQHVDRRIVDMVFPEKNREVTVRRRDISLRHLKAGKYFKLTGRKVYSRRPWIKWYIEYWSEEELRSARIEAEELIMLL